MNNYAQNWIRLGSLGLGCQTGMPEQVRQVVVRPVYLRPGCLRAYSRC